MPAKLVENREDQIVDGLRFTRAAIHWEVVKYRPHSLAECLQLVVIYCLPCSGVADPLF